MRSALISLVALSLWTSCTLSASAQDLSQIPREIGKQPDFQTDTPRYCLAVFGPEAKTHVWLVQDGDILYADLNSNGDLTDAGEKFAAEEVVGQRPGDHYFKIGDFNERGLEHKRFEVMVSSIDYLATNYDSAAKVLEEDPDARGYRVFIDYELDGSVGIGLGGARSNRRASSTPTACFNSASRRSPRPSSISAEPGRSVRRDPRS